MSKRDAEQHLSHIYDHVARNEVYRGYRSVPVAITGLMAFLAAALQPLLIGSPAPSTFLLYWTIVAIVSISMTGVPVYLRYRRADTRIEHRRTEKTVGQLLPAIIAGALLTFSMYRAAPASTHLLPGLWSILFGLGLYASRPFLPASTKWVALFYLAAGVVLIWYAPHLQFSPWGMGFTFGAGQLTSAFVLHSNMERDHDERS
jgi:hypothetical protein